MCLPFEGKFLFSAATFGALGLAWLPVDWGADPGESADLGA